MDTELTLLLLLLIYSFRSHLPFAFADLTPSDIRRDMNEESNNFLREPEDLASSLF